MSSSKTKKSSEAAISGYSYDATINITAHTEGYLLYKTLRAIKAQIQFALNKNPNLTLEINLGLDNSNVVTSDIAERFKESIGIRCNIYRNSFNDPSVNRNYLIDRSHGEYLFTHDGDDLFTENFLYAALSLAKQNGAPAVYTPQFLAPFGHDAITRLFKLISSSDAMFSKAGMFTYNSFQSQNLVHAEIYKKIKYMPSTGPYGYEDWHWGANVLSLGYEFISIKNTIIFYRKKPLGQSLLGSHEASNCVMRTTSLFDPKVFAGLTRGTPRSQEENDSHFVDYAALMGIDGEIVRDGRPIMRRVPSKIVVRLFGKHRTYFFLKNQYHAMQQLFEPYIRVLRYLNTLPNFLHYQHQSVSVILPGGLRKKLHIHHRTKQSIVSLGSLGTRYNHRGNMNRLLKAGFNNTHIFLWKKLNHIEPKILFDSDSLARLTVSLLNRNDMLLDKYYQDLCIRVGGNVTDMLLVPFIIRGGADLAMIQLVNSLAEQPGRSVLVVTTQGMDSVWKNHMMGIKGVTFLESHIDFPGLNVEELETLLLRVIQNWDIATVTIMNSRLGYQMIAKYGQAIASHTKLFFHFYGLAYSKQGLIIEWIPLPEVYDFATKFITDCRRHENELQEIYGWQPDKTETIYLPMNSKIPEQAPKKITKRIIFAGRIAREKAIDVLLKVGEALADIGIVLDIYGTKDEEYANSINFDEKVQHLRNVNFKGAFEGYGSINLSKYDLLLYTSLSEGIPLVILDTIKANLFIVSANVGGIAEVIHDGKNGFLVHKNTTPDEYIEKVRAFYQTKELHNLNERRSINAEVIAMHSIDHYKKSIISTYLG